MGPTIKLPWNLDSVYCEETINGLSCWGPTASLAFPLSSSELDSEATGTLLALDFFLKLLKPGA